MGASRFTEATERLVHCRVEQGLRFPGKDASSMSLKSGRSLSTEVGFLRRVCCISDRKGKDGVLGQGNYVTDWRTGTTYVSCVMNEGPGQVDRGRDEAVWSMSLWES